jgi:hypothetical protein
MGGVRNGKVALRTSPAVLKRRSFLFSSMELAQSSAKVQRNCDQAEHASFLEHRFGQNKTRTSAYWDPDCKKLLNYSLTK